jgi:hypothetical protein
MLKVLDSFQKYAHALHSTNNFRRFRDIMKEEEERYGTQRCVVQYNILI